MRRMCLGLILLATLSGCGGDAPTLDATTPPDTSGAKVPVGSSIRLEAGERLAIRATVTGIIDPLTGQGSVDTPAEGRRFVGVQLSLSNVGPVEYSDAPSNGAVLEFDDGHQSSPTIVTSGPCAAGFAARTEIRPGAQRRGCLAFEVPIGSKPATVEFTIDPDLDGITGHWDVRGAGPSTAVNSSAPSSTPSASGRVAGKVCDANVTTNVSTVCAFAQKVFNTYKSAVKGGAETDSSVSAFNPDTGQTLKFTCRAQAGGTISCTGGKRAVIEFSERSVNDL